MQIHGDLVDIWREIKMRPGLSYVYTLSRPDGTLFYVGVGTRRRILLHERPPEITGRNTKAATIREIIAAGSCVRYAIVGWFDTWDAAATEERRLIALHGRNDLGLGPLTNRTNGGQGTVGAKWLSAAREIGIKAAAKKNRGRLQSEETRAKRSAAMKGKVRSESALAKASASLKGRKLSLQHREKLSAVKKGRAPSVEARIGFQKWLSENPGSMAERSRAIWERVGYRERMSEALTGLKRDEKFCEDNKLRQKAKFSDPEFKARWTEKHNAAMAEPENIARRTAALTARKRVKANI